MLMIVNVYTTFLPPFYGKKHSVDLTSTGELLVNGWVDDGHRLAARCETNTW